MTEGVGTIVAVGGGNVLAGETYAIDKRIVELTGKRRPKVLLIPTAAYDEPEGYEGFVRIYGTRLGCRTDVLYLLQNAPEHKAIADKIAWADVVYVPGGNTLKMMRRWRWLGLDRLLDKARKKGTVLAGASAGAICWFGYGHSDSMAFYHPDQWEYIRVRGLGFIEATACPHVLGENRLAYFQAMMAKHRGVGIGIDDQCAVVFQGQRYQILRTRRDGFICKVYRHKDRVITEKLVPASRPMPLPQLLEKPKDRI